MQLLERAISFGRNAADIADLGFSGLHGARRRVDSGPQIADQLGNLARRLPCLGGERPYLVGDHSESFAVFFRAGGFNRRVEREQMCLPRDPRDRLCEHADPFRHAGQPGDRRCGRAHFLTDGAQCRARSRDPLAAAFRCTDKP